MSETVPRSYAYDLEHKEFVVKIDGDKNLELHVDGCVRKRDDSLDTVLYVWTNIELLWEEHKYVEARYNRSTNQLTVTVNRSKVQHREIFEG